MTRKMKMFGLALLALCFASFNAWAVDYSTMSTEELSKLRGTMQTASQAERDAFHAEWSSRVDQMTTSEKQEYMGAGRGMGDGSGQQAGPGDGSGPANADAPGNGNGPGGGTGMGNGNNGGGMGSGGGGRGNGGGGRGNGGGGRGN
jgi:hypothetical protein